MLGDDDQNEIMHGDQLLPALGEDSKMSKFKSKAKEEFDNWK